MMYIYPAVIHEEDSFWLEFPDLEGCQTCGNTLEETLCNAQEALGLYLASLTENGQPLPKASALSEIAAENGQTTYISTDINKYRRNTRAVKKMVSLPEWLADEADANNISLSKTLQDALKKRLSIV
ncbi:MAG: type II toxin-antitoxin system HicB family antitoxin [Firmicutes bacterium]|nr:type II toxin-antitoxin system HicB family antitoxin [Bacillota bacterium]MBQ3931503.1 type II toxin-antitoxin system HicB family antitoxin [Bacillota bacterium]